MELREWQEEAFATLEKHDYNGVLKVASGKGKTVLALAIIKEVLKMHTDAKALVVVPTINLMHQWKNEIEKFIPDYTTSFYYGAKKNEQGQIVLAVINSAAKMELREQYRIKVLDEIHHYGAELYQSIFSLKTLHTIGLSATPERDDEGDLAIRYGAGKTVYSLNNIAELRERFALWTIRVPLTHTEYDEYTDLQKEFYQIVRYTGMDMSKIESQAKRGNKYALRVLKLWTSMAKIRHHAVNKIAVVRSIVKNESDQKIIIFSESIDFSERLAQEVDGVVVHSNMGKKEIIKRLEDFRKLDSGVLVAPRLIDEGYDVPDATVAIVASFTRSPRQMIQRDGRILRKETYVRRYTLLIENIEEEKFFSILQKTNRGEIALQGEWLRWQDGFIQDDDCKAQFESYGEHNQDYDTWLVGRLDYYHQHNELSADFYETHKPSIERILREQPQRYPRFIAREEKKEETRVETHYDARTQNRLKEQLRQLKAKLFLPDDIFLAMMRTIENEKFVVEDDTKNFFITLAQTNDTPPAWPAELFDIVVRIGKELEKKEE